MSVGPQPLIEVEHLTMRFGGLVAVDDVSFAAGPRAIPALIGPNGAGKTTVFNCITGFYKPTGGTMRLTHESGQQIALERLNDFRISKLAKVARTFQNIRLFPGMTALENLMVAQHNALMRASGLTLLGLIGAPSWRTAEKAAIDLAKFWLDRIGFFRRRHRARGGPGGHPALGRPAPARNGARDLHRAGLAVSRRAGCRAERPRKRRVER